MEQAVASRGIARIAISGGSTPKATFKLLADPAQPFLATVPWDKLQLFWVDERCVPPDNPESNYGVCRELLLTKVPIPAANVFRMEGELDPEEAASRYESTLRNVMKLEGAESPAFDLVVLGMGPDGHTASLFPHTEALNEMGRLGRRESRSAEGYLAHHADVAGDQSGGRGCVRGRRTRQGRHRRRGADRAARSGAAALATDSPCEW